MIGDVINQLLEFFMSLGYFGIALGLMIEIIPSEIVLSYAGYMVSQGKINFIEAVIAGTIGGTLAQIFLYWLGYYGGRPFVEKYGKYVLINKHHLDIAESWFNKYGVGVIFSARFIPVVRHAISIPAGLAKMSLWKFTLYTVLAVIPWSIFFIYLGEKLGANWRHIKEYAAPYTPYFIAGALVFVAIYIAYKMKKKRTSH
ncbi:DedA family protein [Ectobacillus antri]|jgi:membrane protein DedA with SNARE-associated domain|uniref:DedA family protein n=1 Tax=Ectobacillus antri TaxID=2486280 RepID=A0ABT6H0N5_9BACI|nr:DedA family protein [Ectobacillus antri]MDG4656265.1 DedA family protein [Ectobacillus antri]MDG5752940.1 DedA family protein [Ectobacillus antri]